MDTQPPTPLSQEEVEGLRLENDRLRALNARLKGDLQRISEAQRKLAQAHHSLEETFRRLMANKSTSPAKP